MNETYTLPLDITVTSLTDNSDEAIADISLIDEEGFPEEIEITDPLNDDEEVSITGEDIDTLRNEYIHIHGMHLEIADAIGTLHENSKRNLTKNEIISEVKQKDPDAVQSTIEKYIKWLESTGILVYNDENTSWSMPGNIEHAYKSIVGFPEHYKIALLLISCRGKISSSHLYQIIKFIHKDRTDAQIDQTLVNLSRKGIISHRKGYNKLVGSNKTWEFIKNTMTPQQRIIIDTLYIRQSDHPTKAMIKEHLEIVTGSEYKNKQIDGALSGLKNSGFIKSAKTGSGKEYRDLVADEKKIKDYLGKQSNNILRKIVLHIFFFKEYSRSRFDIAKHTKYLGNKTFNSTKVKARLESDKIKEAAIIIKDEDTDDFFLEDEVFKVYASKDLPPMQKKVFDIIKIIGFGLATSNIKKSFEAINTRSNSHEDDKLPLNMLPLLKKHGICKNQSHQDYTIASSEIQSLIQIIIGDQKSKKNNVLEIFIREGSDERIKELSQKFLNKKSFDNAKKYNASCSECKELPRKSLLLTSDTGSVLLENLEALHDIHTLFKNNETSALSIVLIEFYNQKLIPSSTQLQNNRESLEPKTLPKIDISDIIKHVMASFTYEENEKKNKFREKDIIKSISTLRAANIIEGDNGSISAINIEKIILQYQKLFKNKVELVS